MINHLLRFENETAALAALPAFNDGESWRLDVVIPAQRVVLARAVYEADESGESVEVSPEVIVPGFYVTVSTSAMLPDILELPGDACRLIGRPETGEILYLAPDVDPEVFATAIVEPMPAGARYTFGNP